MSKPRRHGGKWRIRWFDDTGKRQSKVFPTYKEALSEHLLHRSKVEEVKRGYRPLFDESKRFEDLCEFYIEYHLPRKRGARSDLTIINKHLRPHFGPLLLHDVGENISEYLKSKEQLSEKTIHNHLTLFISMLRIAHYEKKWLAELPRIRKPKITLIDRNFTYLKTNEEIERFLTAAIEIDEKAHYLYATALFTGARAGELAGLQWGDIDFDSRRIKICRSYDGPTKNGETRYVPILDRLLHKLLEWREKCDSKTIVFPTKSGTPLSPSARIFQETLKLVLKVGNFPMIQKGKKDRDYIVFHDLRHTFASHWMMKGGDIFRLQKILGHADLKITLRYSHLSPDVFKEDYDRFNGIFFDDVEAERKVINLY